MEKFATLIIPALLAVVLVRTLLLPIQWGLKLAAHAGCGLVCLWLLNFVAPFTGIYFPVNAVTVLISGLLGLSGIGVMALLAVL